jgi:SOS-response transcriptional repressor LexA
MPSLLHLTPMHSQVYEFILKFKRAHDGVAPTFLEIGRGCGINSTSAVRHVLDSLDLLGMIKCDYRNGKSRMITIPGARWIPPFRFETSSPIDQADRAQLVSVSYIPE